MSLHEMVLPDATIDAYRSSATARNPASRSARSAFSAMADRTKLCAVVTVLHHREHYITAPSAHGTNSFCP